MNGTTKRNSQRSLTSALLALALSLPAQAYNRNDVFAELERITPSWPENTVSVHINDDAPDPGVLVGEPLVLTVRSTEPAYFTLVLVDSKGVVSVIAPDASASADTGPTTGTVYPPAGTGQLVQGEPVGLETIYLYATERPIEAAALGIAANEDFATLGRDPAAVTSLVDTLSDENATGRVAIDRYTYFVDADVELGTRAMRRELGVRVQQVDVLEATARTNPGTAGESENTDAATPIASDPLAVNDIRFEFDSATLTRTGQVQLDIIGSELLRQGESGELPDIALEGHTDDTGPAAYNEALSRRRAESARRYLLDTYDIEESKVRASGRGESAPLVPNTDAASRALNRRVEIRVVR